MYRSHLVKQVLAAVTMDRGAVVVGQPGTGRTTVIELVIQHLPAGRHAVSRTTATEAGKAIPFSVFGQLFPATGEVLNPGRIREQLLRRGQPRTPVLVVDDAHWVDSHTANTLLGLAHEGQIRMILTARGDLPIPGAVVSLWKDRHLRRIDLPPLDAGETAALLHCQLGGPPASTTTQLLHQWTGGNPRLTTELVRHGLATGSLVEQRGLWWWCGPLSVPEHLAELFLPEPHRLSPAQRDALAAVAVSSRPLPIDLVDRIAPETVDALEDLGLLRTVETDGEVVVEFRNPLLQQLVWSQMSALRRQRIAATMVKEANQIDGGRPDPMIVLQRVKTGATVTSGILARIARWLRPHSPEMALRLTGGARRNSGSAAVVMARALAELGAAREAQSVLHQAMVAHASPKGRALIGAELAMHRCLSERDPSSAHADLRALRAAAPATALSVIDATDATVLLLGQRPADALQIANSSRDLRRNADGSTHAALTCRLVRATALALSGRTREAAAACAALVVAAGEARAPDQAGLALALSSLIGLWRDGRAPAPATDPILGRWPRTPGSVPGTRLRSMDWPLLIGYAHLSSGEFSAAIKPLREALAQQAAGLRPFRSEASAWLVVCLAATGEPDAAQVVLDNDSPDGLAVLPGLGPWADGAVAAARGDLQAARRSLKQAAASASASGAWSVELQYLTYAAWCGFGEPDSLTEQITACLHRVDAPRLLAEARAGVAMLHRDGPGLLKQAVSLAEMGLNARAWRLAEAATRVLSGRDPGYGAAVALAGRLRGALGLSSAQPTPVVLTIRETEVGALAATGLSNRDIASQLVISVRTVESHLIRVYRKLGVGSRQELRTRWFGTAPRPYAQPEPYA